MTTSFDESQVRRVQQGVTAGGQFTAQPRPEAGVSLDAPGPATVRLDVHAAVLLDRAFVEDALPFPKCLGEPTLDFYRDSETGKLTLEVWTDRLGLVEFVRDHDGGVYVQFQDADTEQDLDEDDFDALIAYGETMCGNVDGIAFLIEHQSTGAVRDQVLAIAAGTQKVGSEESVSESATRANRVLRAWVDRVEEDPAAAVTDALVDLVHFARARDLDLASLLGDAAFLADDQQAREASTAKAS
ncbi:hypothetical protein [Pseudactinotalea terrae]|uniref:hypothetical protein n=1 Tax=Pseudactinotalea terrae TaxID=1743262 RepID=UPI0012E1D5FF|nr:hypothetical protein [Pseudactinotalea terrae]